MHKISLIFPGYGLHNIEFLKSFIKNHITIKNTFNEASDILHDNIYYNCFKKKNNSIYLNKNMYLLTFISSIAIYRLLSQEISIKPTIIAGHSLGQYSALVCNGNILFQEALKFIKIRNKIMLLAVKNVKILTLVIIGLNYILVKKICSLISTKKKVFISIINSNEQVVITGNYSAVYSAGLIFKKQLHVKVIRLPMLITPHCLLMKNHKKKFSHYLNKITILKGNYPIISNHKATILYSKKDIYCSLVKQLYKTIQWEKSIIKIISMGVNLFIEIGPGQILTNLNKKYLNISSYSTNSDQKLSLVMDILKNYEKKNCFSNRS
ncbi:Malonyl CoA-acyl carrier protein transacylase [Buchnera aphidicola (Cinara kochiana kochiana)]|uniref:Malonyl CoA-acyl carrier protein transacylase n=1 Tax=Buchnera aphidicola (Cinara kochiana kochiana) TaxID=2518976 RepID=A0A451D5U4_9GAMM|nr:acyltransferase domain-containing protein [Buchnera aphidicola]VFP81135.1 Malonyl CoA-acyl carrier protein transacylase [Buchnera aphidicola (Cinara kochiana kochiana)]